MMVSIGMRRPSGASRQRHFLIGPRRTGWVLASLLLLCAAPVRAQTFGDLTDSRTSNAAFFRFTEPGDVTINVSVWGGVVHPGLYEVPEGTRLNTVITLAGGVPLGVIDGRGDRIERTLKLRLLRPTGDAHQVVYEHTMHNGIVLSPENPMLSDDDFLVIELEERVRNPFTWREGISIITAIAALALAGERLASAFQ